MKIGVIGSGSWGTTLSLLLYDNGHSVKLWFRRKSYLDEVMRKRENFLYLPDVKIPEEIFLTADIGEVVADSEILVLAFRRKH
jgi:glycerol-3-phosphate dehydrogenase (NAD(P)+)